MITIIAGTNRPDANSRKVAHSLLRFYENAGKQAQILDLADLPQEIFLPESYGEKPAGFQPFADSVLASSGLHVVTPEYNGGFPGILKYFIDMLPFPESFEDRPVAFTGVAAGMFGALRPVEQLQQIFAYRNAHIYPSRVFIMKVNDVLNDAGELDDAEIAGRLKEQSEGFAAFVAQLNKK
ncbi:NADPH-dependent oxidoreductase [Coraliomargarita sinensis]|uniref:NADPH-dependent oxidoreductase n=1 Tax=Coraliomargarita sinensis TaxID=2174842 RepID=A0A317ZMQ3_9BACT|nr:NAD(P)H-dependent oxidoreductase [Coraliomargarita sinensis]PXA05228.1 NADPH-dependent oxidoreductase [Coraliomargarita sinensis]